MTMHQMLTFMLAHEKFGVNILKIQEVIRFQALSFMEKQPECVDGILQYRNKWISVVNLKKRVGLQNNEVNQSPRIIISEVFEMDMGFIAEQVNQILYLLDEQIEHLPDGGQEKRRSYLQGYGRGEEGHIIEIVFEKLFNPKEVRVLKTFDEVIKNG